MTDFSVTDRLWQYGIGSRGETKRNAVGGFKEIAAAKAADPAWKAGKPIKPGALDGITRESVEANLKKSSSSLSSVDIQI